MAGTNITRRSGAQWRRWFLLAVMVLASAGAAAEQPVKTVPSPSRKPMRMPRANPSTFTRDMPFGEAIQILRRSTRRPLNIVVLWKEIGDNAGVYPETPIGFDGIRGLSVRQNLEILLGSISATSTTKLGYVVNRGVVVIATRDRLPKPKRVTRVYDVSDLVAPPSRALPPGMMMCGFGRGMGMGGPGGSGPFGQYGATGRFPGVGNSFQGRGSRR